MRRAGKTEEDFDVKGEENGDGQEAD
jgi:hypothetical protein